MYIFFKFNIKKRSALICRPLKIYNIPMLLFFFLISLKFFNKFGLDIGRNKFIT